MATYSHSRVSTFEQCPRKYKFQYIDKEIPEIDNTIEAFMGDIVHQTLEKLYKDKRFIKRIAKSSIIKFYRDLWEKEYTPNIRVVKTGLTAGNYKKMGERFISDYFDKYKPFDQLTILGLETQDRMTLPDGNQWHVRIDKFACDSDGNYYIIDYKTNSKMKDQEEADSDRQLAMYSFWVRDKFRDAKSVKLVWHMLAFNKEVVSERTDEQLAKLQNEVIALIKEIETAKEFPTRVTALCDYCGFRHLCPSFKHKLDLETKDDVREFKDDDGVKIVDRFSEVRSNLKELQNEEEKLRADLVEFARQKGLDVVYGSNTKASVKDLKKIILPEDKAELITLIKKKGLWDEFSMLNYPRFNSLGRKGELDNEIMNEVELGEDWRVSLSKRKDVEGGVWQ